MRKLIFCLLILSASIFAGQIDVADDGSVCWISGGSTVPLGGLTFEVYRNDFHHKALAQESLTSNGVFECSGDAATGSTLSAVFEKLNDRTLRVCYLIGYQGESQGLFRPRFRFVYPKRGLLTRPEDTKASRSGDQRVLTLDYGPVQLSMKSRISDFEWVGVGGKESLPMNMDVSKGVNLQDREVVFEFQILEVSPEDFVESVHIKIDNALDDAEACLTAWKENPALPETDFPNLGKRAAVLRALASSQDMDRAAIWQEAGQLAVSAEQLIKQVRAGLVEHRDAFYAQTKTFNERMHFKIGLSYDADPTDRLDKWALFNLNFFRISTLPKWLGDLSFKQRVDRIHEVLNQAAQFGAQAIVTVAPEIEPEGPAEIPFSHDLLPVLRPSFYKPSFTSARHREAWVDEALAWMSATEDLDNIYSFKVGNEPFWSSRPAPAYGYGIGEVGCSNETFRRQILKRYGSFEAWRKQVDQTPMGGKIPWQSLDEISLPEGSIRGLTFIDFLRTKYYSLDALNQAWSSAFASWSEVYPPLPAGKGEAVVTPGALPAFDLDAERTGGTEFLSPAAAGVAAWTDWVSYWPAAVNDQLTDIYTQVKQNHPNRRVSVNCITGQFLNNYLGAGADSGLNPWITAKGLDDLSIDFYALAYMQAYLRSLAGAAGGRPVIIQETGGAEPIEATYMAMYSFAYGADGLLFWRRDHEIPPRVCLELSRAQQAMADPDLQHNSHPFSDGVAMMYSFASLRLADAQTGDAGAYLDAWQAESLLLSRLGVLFDVYSDQQCESAIPAGVKVLFCPSAMALSDKVLDAVGRFVERGGCLVASDRFAGTDPYGRRRDAKRVAALLNHPRVLCIPVDKFSALHDEMAGVDHNPRAWEGFDLPEWSEPVADFLKLHAPPTVTYSDYVLPAARRSENALYVFIDPWAKGMAVTVNEKFESVTELFSGQSVDPGRKINGPAILKYKLASPVTGPMKIGTNFKTKMDRLDKDLSVLDDFGFESVRMGTLPFDEVQGDYRFPDVEKAASELLKRPIDLLFSMDLRPLTAVDRLPEMFNNPQALLTDQNGQMLFQQSFRNFNFNDPDLLKRWDRFIHDFATMAEHQDVANREVTLNFNNELHYAPRGSIVGRKPKPDETYDNVSEKLHLGYSRLRQYFHPERGLVGDFTDGFHLTDYSVFTIAEFQKWLSARYGNIATLNRIWGSNWSAFKAVEPPRELPFESAGLDASWMDWLAFRFENFQSMFTWVKETNPSEIPVSHNFIAGRYLLADPFSGVDLWAMGETMDRMGMDYPDVFDLYLLSATDKPFHIIEASVGYTADYMYRETLLAAIGGARSINFWQRDMDYVAQRSNAVAGIKQAWPLVHRLGGKMETPKVAVFYSHQAAFANLKANASVFAPIAEEASDDDSLQALTKKISGGERSFPVADYLGDITASWMALMESGYAAHPIGSATLTAGKGDRYGAIVVPAATALRGEDVRALCEFNGMLLAWGRNWGVSNEWLQPSKALQMLFGCRRVGSVNEPVKIELAGKIIEVKGCDILEPLAGAHVLARTVDGRPVAVANGQSVILGFDLLESAGFKVYDRLAREVLDLQTFRAENSPTRIQLMGALLEQFGVQPEVRGLPPGVWHSLLRDGDTLRLVLYDYQNWSDLWEKQFDESICQWDGKNTQPRCVELLPGADPNVFAPQSKNFTVSVNLPRWKPVHAFCDHAKFLKELDVSSNGDELNVDGMEFLYAIELGETNDVD